MTTLPPLTWHHTEQLQILAGHRVGYGRTAAKRLKPALIDDLKRHGLTDQAMQITDAGRRYLEHMKRRNHA